MISSAFSRARSKIGKWGQGENAIKSALDALCGSNESRPLFYSIAHAPYSIGHLFKVV
jgi:hypothetical protein